MKVLRDIFRRKGRSILTIAGIGIGVFALVVLGAVAENMNVYVSRLVGYYEDVVVVVESEDANFVGMSLGTRPLGMDTVRKILAAPTSPTKGEGVMKGEILAKPVKIITARRAG